MGKKLVGLLTAPINEFVAPMAMTPNMTYELKVTIIQGI